MGAVHAIQSFEATVAEAERCWYDTSTWPAWVDGLEQVEQVEPGWPSAGSAVVWRSGPAGRGRVTERVLVHEALRGQTVAVRDVSIQGRQTVAFTPNGGEVEVGLELEYELLRRNPLSPLVDLLFIRRVMAASLRRTLARFGVQLRASRDATRP